MRVRHLISDYYAFFLVTVLLLLALVFVICKDEAIYFQFSDFLDSIGQGKAIHDRGLYWTVHGTVPYLGGLDVNYASTFNLKYTSLIASIFPYYTYIIVKWIIRILLAIAGFTVLSHVTLGDDRPTHNIAVLCGFLYAIIPMHTGGAAYAASLPVILAVLILLYREPSIKYYIVLFVLTAFSTLFLYGMFICMYVLLFFVIDWIIKRRASWRMLAALGVLSAGYIITEWQLFYVMLISNEHSMRSTFSPDTFGLWQVIKDGFFVFLKGHYQASSMHRFVILPACFVFFLYINSGYMKQKKYREMFKDQFNLIMILIAVNSVLYSLDEISQFRHLIAVIIPPLSGFRFTRGSWMNPFLWYYAFMVILCRIPFGRFWNVARATVLTVNFVILCLVTDGNFNHIRMNLYPALAEFTRNEEFATEQLTYKELFSESLFDHIKEDIGYNDEWSIAYGMIPGILEYNGIATLDGYTNNYPESYREQWKRLIKPGAEHEGWNIEDWWSRKVYVESDQVNSAPLRKLDINEADMYIDSDVFREMGGKYVFSRVRISNAKDLNLDEIGVYSDEESPYNIYVYSLNTEGRKWTKWKD